MLFLILFCSKVFLMLIKIIAYMCVYVRTLLCDRIEVLTSAEKFVTKVEEVFGGVMVSTLICRECLIVSV